MKCRDVAARGRYGNLVTEIAVSLRLEQRVVVRSGNVVSVGRNIATREMGIGDKLEALRRGVGASPSVETDERLAKISCACDSRPE